MHTSGNSSIDTSLIHDIYCGPEVLFEICVAMKLVDNDDDDVHSVVHVTYSRLQLHRYAVPRDQRPSATTIMIKTGAKMEPSVATVLQRHDGYLIIIIIFLYCG